MASNHTEHFSLNQWHADDQVLRTDFNEDNAKIDSALKDLAAAQAEKADQTALDALAAEVAKKATTAALEALSHCLLYTSIGVGGSGGIADGDAQEDDGAAHDGVIAQGHENSDKDRE